MQRPFMDTQYESISPSVYSAYLVRIWREGLGAPWRASSQSVRTGETIYFASLDALFAFLHAQSEAGVAGIPEADTKDEI